MQKWGNAETGVRVNLVVLGRAGRRDGVGCQATSGGKIGVAWAAPPGKRGRGLGARRLPTRGPSQRRRGTGAPKMGSYRHPGAFLQTLPGTSWARPVHARGLSRWWTRGYEEAAPPESGGESSAPSSPATSLRPVSALRRSN